jgi:DNA-binding CsgD family transcriptional regulator
MNRIYNVRQTAKILGLSTNTTYKYLNSGRISAARGEKKGTFRIPHQSLEKFLGTKITLNQINDIISPSTSANSPTPHPHHPTEPAETVAIIHVNPPTISTKIARAILIFTILLIIADIAANQNISLNTIAIRLSIIAIFLLLSYQFGGFVKK